MERLPPGFYRRDVAEVAQDLLGKIVVHDTPDGTCTGRIVETEAYYGNHTVEDPACHAYHGKTERTKAFWKPGGHAYIYICYGIHNMFNVITGTAEEAGGVLIRAVEPVNGVEIMKENRGVEDTARLTNGPGKLTEAFGIDKRLYGHDLGEHPFYLAEGSPVPEDSIEASTRIGISKAEDLLLRFYEEENRFVSQR